ncbi:hypothetical protein HK097_010576 [Rhizophlyctis rosea]|uniref:Uncharacterized protein n=1 Tax=Rhizophlyctis rosea TaxID=64517 RepID=A0AAD5X9B7_9FUNG|nr:hypothetical protein HK097_010576 [Rhizophlyctis rosea]
MLAEDPPSGYSSDTSSEEEYTLPPADSTLTRLECNFPSNRILKQIANDFPNLQILDLRVGPEYDNDGISLCLHNFTFPNLRQLTVSNVNLCTAEFLRGQYPILQSLYLEYGRCGSIELDLPHLRKLHFNKWTFTADVDTFGPSLSCSPRLEQLDCYKLWGLGNTSRSQLKHTLVLPACTSLDFHRSDDLEHLQIYAPKLRSLNLQACFSIRSVQILDRKPTGFGHLPSVPTAEQSKYRVNLMNAGDLFDLSGNVVVHPRCAGVFRNDEAAGFDPHDHYALQRMMEDWKNSK